MELYMPGLGHCLDHSVGRNYGHNHNYASFDLIEVPKSSHMDPFVLFVGLGIENHDASAVADHIHVELFDNQIDFLDSDKKEMAVAADMRSRQK
jgi:hypothetical protein